MGSLSFEKKEQSSTKCCSFYTILSFLHLEIEKINDGGVEEIEWTASSYESLLPVRDQRTSLAQDLPGGFKSELWQRVE
jgi:hypothetical protein